MLRKLIFVFLFYVLIPASFFVSNYISNMDIPPSLMENLFLLPSILLYTFCINQFILVSLPKYTNYVFKNRQEYLKYHMYIGILILLSLTIHFIIKFDGVEPLNWFLAGLYVFLILYGFFVWVKTKMNPFSNVAKKVKVKFLSNYLANKNLHIILVLIALVFTFFHVTRSGFADTPLSIYFDSGDDIENPKTIDFKLVGTLFEWEEQSYISIYSTRILFYVHMISALLMYAIFKILKSKKTTKNVKIKK